MNKKDQRFLDLIDGDWVGLANNEWELLTGVMLDARTPVEMLRRVLLKLQAQDRLDFRTLCQFRQKDVRGYLKDAGYPWWGQKAKCFKPSNMPKFDILTCSFEQITSLYGIGPKLGSLWMRIIHPKDSDKYVVIDTHVRRELRERFGINDMKYSYEELTEFVRKAAAQDGLTPSSWDRKIVGERIAARMAKRRYA